MTPKKLSTRSAMSVIGCLVLSALSTGCTSTVGGQNLPSAWYLRDDIQYFPAGPEMKLSRQEEVLEEYRSRRKGAQSDAGVSTGIPKY